MPRTLILHIGTMKTGSTTIQTLLKHNRTALLERGVCYAGTGGLNNHVLLAYTFCSKPGLPYPADGAQWGGRVPAVAMQETCAQFRQEMRELPAHVSRVIVSSEMLSQYVYETKDIARLRDLAAPFFDDIEVLVYLRLQDGHVASNYSQSLRQGLLRRPSLVVWKDSKKGFTYDYDKLLAPWAEVFGEAAVKPRIFERDTNRKWDVVADFTAAAGTGELLPPKRADRQNPSIDAAGQGALRQIGYTLKGDDESQKFARTTLWRRLTKETTRALPGRGWQPSQAEARHFVQRYGEAHERVRRRWFPDRARLFSDDYGHLPEKPPKVEPDEELHAVTAVLIHVMRETLEREDKQRLRARRNLAVKRALRLNKDDPKARLELGQLMLEEGRLDRARELVEWLLRRDPDNIAARDLEREIEAQRVTDETELAELDMVEAET